METPPVGFPPPESWRDMLASLFDLVAQQLYPYLEVHPGYDAVIITYRLSGGVVLYAHSYYPYTWQALSSQLVIPYINKELELAVEEIRQEAIRLQGELEKFQAKVAF